VVLGRRKPNPNVNRSISLKAVEADFTFQTGCKRKVQAVAAKPLTFDERIGLSSSTGNR
jgi:hypothetical protein